VSEGDVCPRWCILILVRLLNLPGRRRPKRFPGEHGRPLRGSISEKVFADINGLRQGMFIQSKDTAHPVLLCLHGGLPEYFLTVRYPTGLENDFTVVWWEQRGAGLSYSPGIPPETMTLEQFIADKLSVTDYLRNRFSKEKIYLMAHSGGTFIGLQAAARAPEVYCAYVGVAQVVQQLKSERRAYEYMLEQFNETGNVSMVRKLEATPVTMTAGAPHGYLAVRDRAMHSLGAGTASFRPASAPCGMRCSRSIWLTAFQSSPFPPISSTAYTITPSTTSWPRTMLRR
jgi:pimeloyl-ACP methyl ester carboxylesterase